jgi:hypothetical protein
MPPVENTMTDNVERALDSDAPLTAAVHRRDVAREAALGDELFKERQNETTKVALKPDWETGRVQ